MTRTPRILAVLAIATLWLACQTNRPIVMVNDDAGSGTAGTGGSGPGAGGNATGNHDGAATPCDGAALFVCADATKVCRPADCPGGPGGVGGLGNNAGTTGAAGSGGSAGVAGAGAAGTGQVGVGTFLDCPAAPPSGACSLEFMNCAYPDANTTCRCTTGAWNCVACPPAAAPGVGSNGGTCRYGNLTCSHWGCGVCPAAHPSEGAVCGNSMFKCAYGGDVCLCGGNIDGWRCTTLSCPQSPSSERRPNCSSFALTDGNNISFDFACSYPAEKQACSCSDSTSGGTYVCNCPAAAPAEGGACIGPSPCTYGSVTCDCVANQWRCGGGVCPTSKPTAGTACSTQVSCSYAKDGGTDFCACNGSAWSCS